MKSIVYTNLLMMTTVPPSLDIISVTALPIPVPPPVIRATFPSNVPSGSIGAFLTGNMLA